MERTRQAPQARDDERRRILLDLQARALQHGVQVVLPDNDDALQLRDLTPGYESDLDSPVSSAEYWPTWRIDHFND
jgi:hypothetical protein